MKKKGLVYKDGLWGLALAFIVGVVIFATEFIISFSLYFIISIFSGESGVERVFNSPLFSAIYQVLIYATSFGILYLVPKKVKRLKKYQTNRNELGLTGWPTWTDIGLAPVGFLVYLLLASVVTQIFMVFPWFQADQAQDVGFSGIFDFGGKLIAFIALVVVAPIAEEVIFRGWLYGKLRSRMGMIMAILITSVLFGIMHGQWNVGVNVFAMSIVLCGLREVTGTIYAGILLHMVKNGIAFYLLYVMGMG